MKKAQEIGQRIVALFLTSALAIITGASILGDIPMWKAAALAGFTSVAKVVESLAKSSIDGTLSKSEIDAAFGGGAVAKSAAKKAAKPKAS
jgi:hypothetical protein